MAQKAVSFPIKETKNTPSSLLYLGALNKIFASAFKQQFSVTTCMANQTLRKVTEPTQRV
jgi:hypothetical protein